MTTRREALGLAALALPLGGVGARQGGGASGFEDRFGRIDPHRWRVADYQMDHPVFANGWRRDRLRAGPEGLSLEIGPDARGVPQGAAIRRRRMSGFGTYSARMQAARGSGVVTGFFLYSGPENGAAHDEIDIEFLGRDPRRVHLSWWKGGKLRQKVLALGFDASRALHDYRIGWTPERLSWAVNGRVIFETATDIPQAPLRLHLNLWAANRRLSGWAGTYDGRPGRALVGQVAHEPAPMRGAEKAGPPPVR